MKTKTRFKIKLVVVPLIMLGCIFGGIWLGSLESNAENIRFKGVEYFYIITFFPPIVLGFYYIYMIKEYKHAMQR
jgi:Na+-driven multidrug efflux pump